MKQYRALFLDMDGTFLDFHAAEHQAFYRAFALTGEQPTERTYRLYSAVNDSLWKAFERGEIKKDEIRSGRYGILLEKLGIEADSDAIEKAYETFLGEGHELIPHAKEVLEYLSERYPLYTVTNGFAAVQRNRLALAGIGQYMARYFISEEIGFQKPRKEFFDVCFAQIGGNIKPEDVLLIGDSLTSDILGAKNAGIDSCWFNPDGLPNERGIVPEYEIRSLTELKHFL